jgi:hypothetical protein
LQADGWSHRGGEAHRSAALPWGVEIRIYSTERRMNQVEDGIHVALRVGNIVHETMVAQRILSWRHILVASLDLIERHGMPARPDHLYQFPLRRVGVAH